VEPGSVILDILVTPTIASRLRTLAAAWQRLTYKRLKFIINATSSSITGGEYVTTFIPDPADKPPATDAAKWVTAHDGSASSSWWKTQVVHGPCPSQEMYTSFSETDLRYSSPGRLVIAVVSPPTSEASVSVKLDWAVKFSQPSLETELESVVETVYVAQKDFRMLISDGNASEVLVPELFTVAPSPVALTPDDFSPALPDDVYLELPHPKSLNSDTGASGAPENAIVTHLGKVPDKQQIGYFYTNDGVTFTQLLADKPFSIRPVSDVIETTGSVYEADSRSPALSTPALGFQSRARRSLISDQPVLKKLPTGRIVTMSSSKRY
jgi:hypothetical protein